MEIPKELNNDIWEYCRANNITNIDEFTLKLIKQGFTTEKFGSTPIVKTIEVEKIVEKIVEKPVEVPVNMVDTELTEKYKQLLNECENLRKDLAIEKQKNKKDLYGEG
jgi:hypothetical protein